MNRGSVREKGVIKGIRESDKVEYEEISVDNW